MSLQSHTDKLDHVPETRPALPARLSGPHRSALGGSTSDLRVPAQTGCRSLRFTVTTVAHRCLLTLVIYKPERLRDPINNNTPDDVLHALLCRLC